MNDRWLSVVGIGEDGLDGVTPRGRLLIEKAKMVIGGDRHLSMISTDGKQSLTWPVPLVDIIPKIQKYRGSPVCVIATGDPMFYGIGVMLSNHFSIKEMEIVPSVSAFSLVAARLGWSLADSEKISLHGRPVTQVIPLIGPNAHLIILSNGSDTPKNVAQLLLEQGYGSSRIKVFEHMGGDKERCVEGVAATWNNTKIAPFNTLAVKCIAHDNAIIYPRVPGLPDEAFKSDGKITKREVRAATLSALAPLPGEHLWDIGAGCGSIGIEWMRTDPRCRATAVENRGDRIDLIARNAMALGVPRIGMVAGDAMQVMADLDAPDAIFIGGGLTVPGLIDRCWETLPARGRLVANAVTLEGENALASFCHDKGGELSRISVARAKPVGLFTGWKPMMPVTQLVAAKP